MAAGDAVFIDLEALGAGNIDYVPAAGVEICLTHLFTTSASASALKIVGPGPQSIQLIGGTAGIPLLPSGHISLPINNSYFLRFAAGGVSSFWAMGWQSK